jgi:putative drug exporter of the RND superfamily
MKLFSRTKSTKVPPWLRILIPSVLIIVWFGVAGVGGPYFGRVQEVSDIDLAAFLPKSADATKVNNEVKAFRDSSVIPAILVYNATDSGMSTEDIANINSLKDKIQSVKGVEASVSPAVVSDDAKAAFVTVPIQSDSEIGEVLTAVKAVIADKKLDHMNYYASGPAGFSSDLNKAFAGIDGLLLLVALAVVLIILIIVYRSPLLPFIVLMTSMVALTAAIFIVWHLAKANVVQLNGQVQGILFILVIGAATDYSLLYVSRYREELYKHASKWQASINALRAAFEPIIASGGTVIVGLLCLLFSDLASNKALGPVGSIGIGMAILSALTFLPAVLALVGRVAFWPRTPHASIKQRAIHATQLKKGVWHRLGIVVDTHPRRIWVITSVVLFVACLGVFQLRANGVSSSDLVLGYSEAREGQSLLSKHFPAGSGSPALVTAPANDIDKLVTRYDADRRVDAVSVVADNSDAGFKPLGKSQASIKNDIRIEIDKQLAAQNQKLDEQEQALSYAYGPETAQAIVGQIRSNIPTADELVEKAYPFKDAVAKEVNGRILLQVTLKDAPDSQAAEDTIARLRTASNDVGGAVLIGGTTAVNLDTKNASLRDRAVIIPIVLVAITIILMLLLRAVMAPLLLLLTTVISFAASLGISAVLFNHVWHFPGADPSVILYGFVFLVALGIDYNIFLMSRVREETLKLGTNRGVIKGLVVTGGVITSAGVVLAATFAALAVIPILFLAQLAFIVAFGVLLDTLIIRSLLVPALIRDIGGFIWWPSKLKSK